MPLIVFKVCLVFKTPYDTQKYGKKGAIWQEIDCTLSFWFNDEQKVTKLVCGLKMLHNVYLGGLEKGPSTYDVRYLGRLVGLSKSDTMGHG